MKDMFNGAQREGGREGRREGGREGGREGWLTCSHDGHSDRLLWDGVIKGDATAAGGVGTIVVIRPEAVASQVDLRGRRERGREGAREGGRDRGVRT